MNTNIPSRVVVPILTLGLVLQAGVPVSAADGWSENSALVDTRAVVQRALPYLARQTGEWIEQKKCTSCHQVPHALWAMNEARARGFSVGERLTEWNRWSVDFVLNQAETPGGAPERADELYQVLLNGSLADADLASHQGNSASLRHRLISALRAARGSDGGWQAGGQLPDQKRDLRETHEVTTMWGLYALRAASGPDKSAADEPSGTTSREAAPEDTEGRTDDNEAPGTSFEHLALRYLLSLETEEGERASLGAQVLAHQNEDGGWGWLLGEQSDALATGQALYALSHMQREEGANAVRRGHIFLERTQQPDGSWHVPSTLREKEGRSYVVSSDWGTAWAVIGLTSTIAP